MRHDTLTESAREDAMLYALGALDGEASRAFEAHLAEGCPLCEREVRSFEGVAASLATAVPPIAPPPGLRARLLERVQRESSSAKPGVQVWKQWGDDARAPSLLLLRANDGRWEDTAVLGVSVRRLFLDARQNRVTMLVRMAPGTSYPSHRHAGAEECYVLEGDLRVGEHVMRAGDYQRADERSVHGVQSTERGCLLFITSSTTDELIG
jgi:predicted ChrR family anti-sigma factor